MVSPAPLAEVLLSGSAATTSLLCPVGAATITFAQAQALLLCAPHTQFAYASHVASCAESYGLGAVPCGNATSRYCCDPALGQSCYAPDSGHCEQGTYCAPVAGFCCAQEEDLSACASNAGFVLTVPWRKTAPRPGSGLSAIITAAGNVAKLAENLPIGNAMEALDDASIDVEIEAEVDDAGSEKPTATLTTTWPPRAIAASASSNAKSSTQISELSSSSPPVQDRRWIIMGFAIGTVAVFMASC